MSLDEEMWKQTRIQFYTKRLRELLSRLADCTNKDVVTNLFDSRLLKQEVKRLTTGGKLAKELEETKQVKVAQEDDCDGCKI